MTSHNTTYNIVYQQIIKKAANRFSLERSYNTRRFYKTLRKRREEPNIVNAINFMLTMKSTYGGGIHHEEAIKQILKNHDFVELPKEIITRTLNRNRDMRWIEQPKLASHIPNGTFISQPFGSQQSPDFIVKVNDVFVLFIEAKSSNKTCKPTYNSGGVHPGFLYIFTSNKTKSTTIFKGDSVITATQQQLIHNHRKKLRKYDEELNKKLAMCDSYDRGWSFFSRSMIIQSGSGTKTDYMTHQTKASTETKTMSWLVSKNTKKK